MENRSSYEMMKAGLINFVLEQAKLSKCRDKKTAALLVSSDLMQVFSIGINGGPMGGMNCMCDDTKKYTCVHAEMNCLVKNTTIDDRPKILICTKQPCHMCAAMIINANTNINEVWYIEPYRDPTGLEILKRAGIKTYKMEVL